MRNMTVPLGCLKSKQGNSLVIYSPHYTFSAFQKALEKRPVSARSDCKHPTDSLDTLFLNTAGLSPLALAKKANSLRLFRKKQKEISPQTWVRDQWPPLTRVLAESIIKGNGYIYGMWKLSCGWSPTCPQAQPGWTRGTGGLEQVTVRHMVEMAPTPSPEGLSLRAIPKVLESWGVDDTHYEQQQQIQGYHDRKPMAGNPGELAWGPASGGKKSDVGTKRKTFFQSVCNHFWLKEDEMMNLSHEMKLCACSFTQKIWDCLPWCWHAFHQNIF